LYGQDLDVRRALLGDALGERAGAGAGIDDEGAGAARGTLAQDCEANAAILASRLLVELDEVGC
jgi:hypothetical protein